VSLFITFLVPCVASLLLTVTVRAVARRWGIVDHPDGKRKLHEKPVPLWGGVAVYLAVVLGLVVAACGKSGAGPEQANLATVVIVAAGVVCLFGSVDDTWCLNSRHKLLLQVAAVLPVVLLGYSVDRVVAFGYPIHLGWFGVPLTVAWLVGCINALNLLDGMDGLASIVGLVTAAMLAIIAINMGNHHVAVIAVVLAGALVGFLVFNLPPASIFLGDSGSMVIGLVVGILGIQGALKTSTTLAITVPAVIMSLPMFDAALALVRRKLTGRHFDAADRQHIHHRLLDRGLSPWQTLSLIGALCLTTGAAATAATVFRNDALAWITALALMVLMIRLRLFGHHELALARSAVARTFVRLADRLGKPLSVRGLPDPVQLAGLPFDAAWASLVEEVKAWQVHRLELILSRQGAEPRHHTWNALDGQTDNKCYWSVVVAFHPRDEERCELRATGPESLPPALLYSIGLTRVLKLFGRHFADHAEQIPLLATGAEPARGDWDRPYPPEAA
jgi:UDP-GlcNAc:undecaprenyl-phosphate GlcNAc-1-phosphate transferase